MDCGRGRVKPPHLYATIMSSSPILRRLSSSTSTSGDPKEDLINAYEAEEERIINVLSRKLEQVHIFSFHT